MVPLWRAASQPAAQRQQQPARAKQQGRRVVHPKHQLQALREALGQLDPCMHFRRSSISPVERGEQLFVKPAGHAAPRQPPHVAQGAAADVRQREAVQAHGTECVHGQGVQQRVQWLLQTVFNPGASQRQRGQAVGRPGQLAHTQFGAFGLHALAQRALAPKQAHARPQLHDHGFVSDSNAGRELKRPECQRLQRRVSGQGGVVGRWEQER